MSSPFFSLLFLFFFSHQLSGFTFQDVIHNPVTPSLRYQSYYMSELVWELLQYFTLVLIYLWWIQGNCFMINGLYPFTQCRCLLCSGADTQNPLLLELVLGVTQHFKKMYIYLPVLPKEKLYLKENVFFFLFWKWFNFLNVKIQYCGLRGRENQLSRWNIFQFGNFIVLLRLGIKYSLQEVITKWKVE